MSRFFFGASSTVGPTSSWSEASASGLGNYVYENITALTLGAGSYRLGGLFTTGNTDVVVWDATGILSNDPAVTYNQLQYIGSTTLTDPTLTSFEDDRYFGPTLHIGGTPIPEPTTMLLLGSGILGLAGFRRRFRKR